MLITNNNYTDNVQENLSVYSPYPKRYKPKHDLLNRKAHANSPIWIGNYSLIIDLRKADFSYNFRL